ncbi:MAG: YihY/virulence factor BrkB family protein [Trueperaceae bacterium]
MGNRLHNLLETPIGSFIAALYKRYSTTQLPMLAAALSYYAAFSLGPLLILLTGFLGFLLRRNPELLAQYQRALTDLVARLLPMQDSASDLARESFQGLVQQLGEGAILRSLISVGVLVWAGSNFFTSLQLALEIVFGVPHVRAYWRKRLLGIALIAAVALVIAFQVIGGLVISSFLSLLEFVATELHELSPTLPLLKIPSRDLLSELSQFLLATLVFALCFRYLPRRSSHWLSSITGAVISTVGIYVTRYALAATFNFEQFNVIYGIITSFLVILVWLYFAILMFLLGALVAAEFSYRLRQENEG